MNPILVSMFLAFHTVAVAAEKLAPLSIETKDLKDATHIEFSGTPNFEYTLNRSEGAKPKVQLTLKNITPSQVQSIVALRDSRVIKTEINSSTTDSITIEFTLSNVGINAFAYQTGDPQRLVVDLFSETKKEKAVQKRKDPLATLVARKPKAKVIAKNGTQRKIASLEYPEVGQATPEDGTVGKFEGDDLQRFVLDESEIKEEAIVKASMKIFVKFPALWVTHPYLEQIHKEAKIYEIPVEESDENLQMRLVAKLFREQKFNLALRTIKFLKEKYPKTKYAKTLEFIVADCYYYIYLDQKHVVDLDTATAQYQKLWTKYPDDPERFRWAMLVGLNHMARGNLFGVLSTFQKARKEFGPHPYTWQMRMIEAEALRELHRESETIDVLTQIENESPDHTYKVEARFRRGDVYFRLKNYKKAAEEYYEALKRYPNDIKDGPNVLFNLAESLFWEKRYVESNAQFRAFIQKFGSHEFTALALARIGEIFEIVGAPDEKIAGAYMETNYKYRNSDGAFFARQNLNLRRVKNMKPAEVESVLKEFKEQGAKKAELEDMVPYVSMGESLIYKARGDYEPAIETLKTFYQNNSRSPFLPVFAHQISENIYMSIKETQDEKKSIEAIQKYLKWTPWLKLSPRLDLEYTVGKAYEKLDLGEDASKFYDKCLSTLKGLNGKALVETKILQDVPTMDQIQLRMASNEAKRGNPGTAINHIQAIQNPEKLSEPEKIERILLVAHVTEELGQLNKSVAALKELIEAWKGEPALLLSPWMRMAKIMLKMKNSDGALTYLGKIIDSDQDENSEKANQDTIREALQLKGEILTAKGDLKGALESYNQLVAKTPSSKLTPGIQFKIGKLYFDQKNLADATKAWSALKNQEGAEVWDKMAQEYLSHAKWSSSVKKYVQRKPASTGGEK